MSSSTAESGDLSGRLIHAQEQERARLAKDLHDGLSQSLALLAVELELLAQRLPVHPGEISTRLIELSERTREISSEVHRLSRGLHPAKLEQLGLAAALGGFCREVEASGTLCVRFTSVDVPRSLPHEAALCLYRIAQEALQNVVKHSGAEQAAVALRRAQGVIELVIQDDGCGFDVDAVRGTESLGLIGMRERARLVHGHIEFDSSPGQGATVRVSVPL